MHVCFVDSFKVSRNACAEASLSKSHSLYSKKPSEGIQHSSRLGQVSNRRPGRQRITDFKLADYRLQGQEATQCIQPVFCAVQVYRISESSLINDLVDALSSKLSILKFIIADMDPELLEPSYDIRICVSDAP